jgi:H(+)-translocating pyrophosphatase
MGRNFFRLGVLPILAGLFLCSPALAAAERSVSDLPLWWWTAPICAVIALVMAFVFYKGMMVASEGNDRMKEIAQYVREGAMAYLKRQYFVVAIFFAVVCVILFVMGRMGLQHEIVFFAFLTGGFFSGLAGFFGMKTATNASARTAQAASESLDRGLKIAFRAGSVMGLVVVGLALIDITAWFFVLYVFTGMSLEHITVVMLTFGMGASSQALFARVGGGIYTKAADVGADLVGKVEAGIPEDDPRNPATIADNVGDNVGDVAGMGADLYESYAGSILATAALGVAAVTFGGPQFISTLPAKMQEVYASTGIEMVALYFLAAPMMMAAAGIILSIAGIFLVSTKEGASMAQLMFALNKGIWGSSAFVVIAALLIVWGLGLPMGVFWAVTVGLVVGLIIGYGTEYYTSASYKPTKKIADQAVSGTGPLIIGGIAEGMLSTWIPIIAVSVGMLLAFGLNSGFENILAGLYGVGIAAVGMLSTLGITLATDAYGPIADNAGGNAEMSELPPQVRERTDKLDSLGNTTAAIGKGFAIGSAALTALALLAAYVEEVRVGIHREVTEAYVEPAPDQPYEIIVLDPYTPENDADYLAEHPAMRHLSKYGKYGLALPGGQDDHNIVSLFVSEAGEGIPMTVRGKKLHLVPNQYFGEEAEAILHGLLVEAGLDTDDLQKAGLKNFMNFYNVTLMNPQVLIGVFFGVLMVFVFAAMTMQAVGRAAMAMVMEVRRQFKDIPGIMEGKATPEYAKCVAISTAGAQREMVVPSLLAVTAPIAVGLVLGVAGVLGLLVGGLCCGFAVAVFMANTGGAWDNAKKLIETGEHGGKGSDAHKAAVVGDTVGDPFKDTTGPSLNILIKLMNMVSIVFAGVIVAWGPKIGAWLGIGG